MTDDIDDRRPLTIDGEVDQDEWRRTRNRQAQRKCRQQRRQRDEMLQNRPDGAAKSPTSPLKARGAQAGGRDELPGGNRHSSDVAAAVATIEQILGQASFEEGAVARLAFLVAAAQSLGFPTLDAAIKAYYTEDLSGGLDSSTTDRTELVQAQRDSRRRHLRNLLVALQHSVKTWSPDESRGLREEAARIAEGVYTTDLKLICDDFRFTTALSAVLSSINNLQDLLITHLPQDAVSELSSLIDTLVICLT